MNFSRYNHARNRLALMAVFVVVGLLCWQLGFGWGLTLIVAVISALLYRYMSRKNSAALAKDRLLRERQVELGATADQTGRAAAGQRTAT